MGCFKQKLNTIFVLCFLLAALSIIKNNGAVLALLLVYVVLRVCSKWEIPYGTLILLLGGIALRLLFVFIIQPPILSDFQLLYEAATAFAAGDNSFQTQPYFTMWAYQSGFIAWQAIFLRIWSHPFCLKLVNCVLSSGTVCLLYRIACGYVQKRAAQAAAALATMFPFHILLPTILTNQISSAFFLMLGTWLLISRDCDGLHFWRYPLAGLALQIGNLLRPEGIILLVAAISWGIFSYLERPPGIVRTHFIWGLATLLIIYVASHAAAGCAVRTSGLNDNGLSNGNPYWKFVTGLNLETSGQYAVDDYRFITPTLKDNLPTDATFQLEKWMIKKRFTAPPSTLFNLFQRKLQTLWGEDALYWFFGPFTEYPEIIWYQHSLVKLLQQADRAIFYCALTLAASGLIRRRHSADSLFCYFVVFATFCAMLIIEIQPRYAYLPQLFLFPGAAFGLEYLQKEDLLCKRK